MIRRHFILIMLTIGVSLNSLAQWEKEDILRMQCLLSGKYDSALYYAGETMAQIRGIKGENNKEYASALGNNASAHFYLGNYAKAKFYVMKEIALRESMKADNDASYLSCLENATVILRRTGDYEEALVQMKKAEKKSLRLNGGRSAGYARTLSYLGGVYYDMGAAINDLIYLKNSKEYFEKAEALNKSLGQNARFALIQNKSDQAAYNNDIGNLPASEIMLQEVLDFSKAEYGVSHVNYAAALNNLGVFYYNSGNYKFSEKCLADAAAIYKGSSEAKSSKTGICINNLGALYHEMGNYARSEKLLMDARNIFELDHQKGSPFYAILLNNLSAVYISQEFYAAPENKSKVKMLASGKLSQKADSIFSLNCPNLHPSGLIIRFNLAISYLFNGEKEKAVKMINDQALESNLSMKVSAMMNKMPVSGTIPLNEDQVNHPAPEPSMIAVQLKMMDQAMTASMSVNPSVETDGVTRKLFELVLGKATRLKSAVGRYHPVYAAALKSLITAYAQLDMSDVEEELTLEYMDVINHRTLQDFTYLSENEKEFYYQTRLPDMHTFTAFSLRRQKDNPAISGYTYNNILLNKGLMLKSSTAMRVAILGSNNRELLGKYDEWIDLQKEISAQYSTPVEIRTKDVAELEKHANELEKTLVAESQDFSDYRKGQQITWEDVKKSLKSDEAAIEFTDFRRIERDGGNKVIYAALIVRPQSVYPEMIKLFEESQLREIIGAGAPDAGSIDKIYGSNDNRLYELVWKPLEQYLNGVKTVFISPSGLLFRLSFPAISNGKNTWLCDKYFIQVEGSTGISSKQETTTGSGSALIFGGIQYSHDNTGSQVWNYLEGTRNEGNAIKGILSKANYKVDYLTENNATETYFKQNAGNFNILHLATHGFFFDDPNEVKFEEKKEKIEYGDVVFRGASRGGFGVSSFVNNSNPLMRSGLVLAGANDVWVKTEQSGNDDGVLTAQEVTQIDMRKNDLVVLSACETGLGDIRGSEGVYGLQRALKMAGVKKIIMSLWEIPDRETVEFMSSFYEYLLTTNDIQKAFSQSQHEMRLKYTPYYWGAFVLME